MVLVNDFIHFFAQCKNFSNTRVIFARNSLSAVRPVALLIHFLINIRKVMSRTGPQRRQIRLQSCKLPSTPPLPKTDVYKRQTEAVAFSSLVLSAVPKLIGAGEGHVIRGIAFRTLMSTVACLVVYFLPSAGVKLTVSVWVPGGSNWPAAGEYVKTPGTIEVAFSSVAPNGVP